MRCATIPPLAGHTVAVTGDRRAGELGAHLRALGASALTGTVVRTDASTADLGELWAATAACIACPPDVLLATTAVGLRAWFDAAAVWGLRRDLLHSLGSARIVARGPQAVGALHAAGLGVWHAQLTPPRTSDAVDAIVADGVDGGRVAYQAPAAEDAAVERRLRRAGANVVSIRAYDLARPDDLGPARRLVRAVAERRISAVTFTSRAAVRNLFALDERGELTRAMRTSVAALCIGPVVAGELERTAGIVAEVPSEPTLGALAHHVGTVLRRREHHHVSTSAEGVVVQGRLIGGAGGAVVASEREAAVLRHLLDAPRRVVSAESVRRAVWPNDDVDPSVLDTTMLRLRRRLRGTGVMIETVRRRGYVLDGDVTACPLTATPRR